jgi:hypothetical protein
MLIDRAADAGGDVELGRDDLAGWPTCQSLA